MTTAGRKEDARQLGEEGVKGAVIRLQDVGYPRREYRHLDAGVRGERRRHRHPHATGN